MLPPSRALFYEQIVEIKEQLKRAVNRESFEWFDKREIDVINKNDIFLLNPYEDADLNRWNKCCNGLAIKKLNPSHFTILSVPVEKLEIVGHKEDFINYTNCELIEKVPGELISVYCPLSIPELKSFNTVNDVDLQNPVKQLVRSLNFTSNDVLNCYTFQYHEDKFYLVGGRYLKNMHEYEEKELDVLAANMTLNIKVERPVRFKCTKGLKQIQDFIDDRNDLFIVRDCFTGERAKAYKIVERKKLVSKCRFKRLIPFWLKDGHRHVIAQLPNSKIKFDEIDARVSKLKHDLIILFHKWNVYNLTSDGLSQSLKTSMVPPEYHKIILRLYKLQSEGLHNERLGDIIIEWLKKMNVKQLMSILKLKD